MKIRMRFTAAVLVIFACLDFSACGLDTYSVTVDYNQPLAEMIKAGEYDYISHFITAEHFPIKREGKVETTLEFVHFYRSTTSSEVLTELDKRGLRPATLSELLAFGAKFPKKQKKFPIVALGSVYVSSSGIRMVPVLLEDDSKRGLYAAWSEFGWCNTHHFLAVRK